VRKALLLARHDIIGQYSDRTALLRSLLFTALPIVIVLVNRRNATGRGSADVLLLVFGLYSALLPAASAINAASGSFAGEKEAQTLVPLLAAPIRDVDIVIGKLLATLLPAAALSLVSIIAFDIAAHVVFGADRVSAVLQPTTLFAFFTLGVFFVLTLGSWVMVLSSRANTQRSAQQIAGFMIAGMFVGLSALGALALQDIAWDFVVGILVALLASDIVALELARRLWNREEAIARV
jgi:ABC-type Na+ efflux pump permease subunit